MVVKRILSLLRARSKRKRNEKDRRAEARKIFLERFESAFPESLKKKRNEAVDAFAIRQREVLKRRSKSREVFSLELKRLGLSPLLFSEITITAAKNDDFFVKWCKREFAKRGVLTLSQVVKYDSLTCVLIAVRNLYASDVADVLEIEVVLETITKVILVKKVKRA